MTINKTLHRIWKKELDSYDFKKIASEYNISVRTIERAKQSGKCNPRTMNCINLYLSKKKYEFSEFLKQFKK